MSKALEAASDRIREMIPQMSVWFPSMEQGDALALACVTAYLRAVGEDEVVLDRVVSAIAKRNGCDKGTFTVCWGEHERGEVCGCKEDARAALSALEPQRSARRDT